jgi:hypothetical protein
LFTPKEAGDTDFAWTREYGNAVCIKGAFGVEYNFLYYAMIIALNAVKFGITE